MPPWGGYRCQKCRGIIKFDQFRYKYKKIGEDSKGRPKYNWICNSCKLQEEKNENSKTI